MKYFTGRWTERLLVFSLVFLAFGFVFHSAAEGADLKDLLRGNLSEEKQPDTITAASDSEPVEGQASETDGSGQIEPRQFKIAVMSDIHLTEENRETFQNAIDWVNSRADINAVVLLGDLSGHVGSKKELEDVARMIKGFRPEVWAIPGNHDYYYEDQLNAKGKLVHAGPAAKARKLERFRLAFDEKKIRFSRKRAGHLLVFLPTDDLTSRSVVSMSQESLTFLRNVLDRNPHRPAIIFYHAPLEGSYTERAEAGVSELHAAAQPADRITEILESHPKAFLWVAGHQHRKPKKSVDFPGATVGTRNKVTVIPVSNVTGKNAWIRLLELTPESTLIRTFELKDGTFLPEFERRFDHPTEPIMRPR